MKGTIGPKGDISISKEVFAVMILETIKGGELFYHIRKCK